jgi:hypothetical protein
LWRPRDTIFLAGGAAALGAGLWGLLQGFGSYSFYPRLDCLISGPGTVAALLAVLFSLFIPLLAVWGCGRWPYLMSKI